MDDRSKWLGLALFGLFAVALGWAASSLRQTAQQTQEELSELPEAVATRRRPSRSLSEASLSASQARIGALREQVERLTEHVNRLTKRLEQKSADYDKLKTRFDRNTDLMLEAFATDDEFGGLLAGVMSQNPDAPPMETDETMVLDLQMELEELHSHVEELEMEAVATELQIIELQDRRDHLETVAADALVRAGPAAVPSLIDLLSDRRAEMRRWAAMLLGDIGAAAGPAIEALQETLSDSDENVRTAARRALNRIVEPSLRESAPTADGLREP